MDYKARRNAVTNSEKLLQLDKDVMEKLADKELDDEAKAKLKKACMWVVDSPTVKVVLLDSQFKDLKYKSLLEQHSVSRHLWNSHLTATVTIELISNLATKWPKFTFKWLVISICLKFGVLETLCIVSNSNMNMFQLKLFDGTRLLLIIIYSLKKVTVFEYPYKFAWSIDHHSVLQLVHSRFLVITQSWLYWH